MEHMICAECDKEFSFYKSVRPQAKWCSRSCHSKAMMRENNWNRENHPRWKGGVHSNTYRIYLKDKCEWCGHDGSKNRLEIHHVDKDYTNGVPSNLLTLCSSCHRTYHNKERRRQKEKR